MGKRPLNKKKAIREMREGVTGMQNPDGSLSTHRMGWVGDISQKRGSFGVYPTIRPKEGKEKSTSPDDWEEQTPEQAKARGEMINVKSRNKAEKLAAGSWKQGEDRKEAMHEYRENRMEEAYRKRLEASEDRSSYPEVNPKKRKK